MKKILIILPVTLLILLSAGLIIIFKNSPDTPRDLVSAPEGDTIIKNSKYGFEFSYPKNRGLDNIDEWDNGLPGSNDGGVYGYSATGNNMGPFTDHIKFSIYNVSLKKYLSKYKIKEFEWQTENIKKFGKKGTMFTNKKSISNSKTTGGVIFCELLFEHNNLLYIIDCNIEYFKFYN